MAMGINSCVGTLWNRTMGQCVVKRDSGCVLELREAEGSEGVPQ